MKDHYLKNIPLFSSLTSGDFEELAKLMITRSYPAHHTLFWMHERGTHLYIIDEGNIEISYTNEEGEEVSLAVLGKGSFFGEISLLDGEPHSATARTMGPATLFTIDRETFHHYLNKHPQLAFTLLKVLTKRLRSSTMKMPKLININQQLEAQRTPIQKSVDAIVKILTHGYFLALYILFIASWIVFQVIAYHNRTNEQVSFTDHPPDFPDLSFFIALTSFLLTILILNSQRRQSENDRIQADIEYQINLKAQMEVMKLQLKMDQLLEELNMMKTKLGGDDKIKSGI